MITLRHTYTKCFAVLLSALILSSCSEKNTEQKQGETEEKESRRSENSTPQTPHSVQSAQSTQRDTPRRDPIHLKETPLGGLEDLLPNALVATSEASAEETQYLKSQLQLFEKTPTSTKNLEAYIERYPQGAYALALRNSLSSIYYTQGRLSEVLENSKQAWQLGSTSDSPTAQYLADEAYSAYSKSLTFFGLREELRTLVTSVEERTPAGFASLAYLHAVESLASMELNTESSHLCGPHALYSINLARGTASPQAPLESPKAVSSEKGMNFAQIQDIADDLSMGLTVAKANQAETIPVPSVISWKPGHFSAVVERLPSGKLKVQDTLFSQPLLIEPSTLLQESSGYFMVPIDQLSSQWVKVSREEAATIWGAHTAVIPNPDDTILCPVNCGMAGWSVDKLHIDHSISDTPLLYQPAFGPTIAPRLSYRNFTTRQGATFDHANLGLKWNLNWISYVEDNPTQPEAAVVEYQPNGGGARTHLQIVETATDGTTSMVFSRDQRNQNLLQRTGEASYQLLENDGSIRIYNVSDRGTTARRIFCSQYIDPQGHSLTYHYDDKLRLTALTDATGKQTTLSYDHTDPLKITAITDPYGRQAKLEYNQAGLLETITDVIGIQSSFHYDETDFIDILRTPYGDTKFAAENQGQTRKMLVTMPNGEQQKFIHYLFGSPEGYPTTLSAEETLPIELNIQSSGYGSNATYHWDRKAMKYHPDDPTKTVQYKYLRENSRGFSIANIVQSIKRPLENRVIYRYPGQTSDFFQGSLDRPISVIQALPNNQVAHSKTEYNALGLPTKVTDPLGRTTLLEYAPNGIDLIATKQQVGAQTQTLLEVLGYENHLPTSLRDASGNISTLTYNSRGQLTTTTDPLGRKITLEYIEDTTAQGYGKVQRSIAIEPENVTSYTYDALERVATSTTPDGYTTAYTYDAFDRPLSMTYEDGSQSLYEYKDLDLVKSTDREGRVTTYQYDSLRQLISQIDPENRLTRYHWCTCGGLETLTDALGRVTKWTRDLQGRVQKKALPDGRSYTYLYDTAGRQISMTDPKGQTRRWSYHPDGTTAAMSYENALIPTEGVSYSYDPHYPRLSSMTDQYGTTSYSYVPYDGQSNAAGSIASTDGPWQNDTLTNSYDILGRLTSYTFPGSGGSLNYDTLGRMAFTSNVLGTTSYSYDGVTSRILSTSHPQGISTNYHYQSREQDYRLQQIQHSHSTAGDISSFSYEYSPAGRILAWNRKIAPTIAADRYEFSYDTVDQLTSATLTEKATRAIKATHAYSYDQAGNRTSSRANQTLRQHTYNEANQQLTGKAGGQTTVEGSVNQATTSITVAGQPAFVSSDGRFLSSITLEPGTNRIPLVITQTDGTVTKKTMEIQIEDGRQLAYIYDLNGNLEKVAPSNNLNAPEREYSWDAADRLHTITRYENNQINTSAFGYNSANQRVEIQEYTGTAGSLELQSHHRYIWSGHRPIQKRDATGAITLSTYTGNGQLDSPEAGGSGRKLYYARDHLGSIRNVYSSTGEEIASYDYSPYGKRTLVSGSEEIEFGYTGHHYHPASKTILTQYRGYDPNTGRWLSPDPLEEAGGINLYRYSLNNPINMVDPDGLRPFTARETAIGNAAWARANGGQQSAITDLADAISAIPEGTPDPAGISAAVNALDKWASNNPNYGLNSECPSVEGGPTRSGPNSWKCNRFVADCYGEAVGWDPSTAGIGAATGNGGYPLGVGGGSWPPNANSLAREGANIRSMTNATDLGAGAIAPIGAIISYPATTGSGHTGIAVGDHLIDAGSHGVRFRPLSGISPGTPRRCRTFTGSGK